MYENIGYNTSNNSNNGMVQDVTSQRVELYLSCRNLLDMDVFSKSDPYIKVYFRVGPNQMEKCLGKTQTVDNNLNPNFRQTFIIDYIFEARQQLRFEVFDEDDGKNDEFIGAVMTTIGSVAGAKNQTLILNLLNNNQKKKPGKLIIRLEPCSQCSSNYLDNIVMINMKWRGKKLMNTDSFFDFWDKSDPYLKFLKIRTDNSFIESGRTEVVNNNLQPNFKNIKIAKNRLVNPENNTQKIKVQCWDWEKEGEKKHQFIGQIQIQLNKLKQGLKFPIQLPLKNKNHKNPGFLILDSFSEQYQPTFFQYIKGGLQLNLSIAIDFTGSNGMPSQPSSLHYMNPTSPNQYQQAIYAVARILLNYDSDQRIPCFGFGAKPFTCNYVSHCFPLSGNQNQLQAFGIEHLMELYRTALFNVQFSGPTFFAPIISQALKIANANLMNGANIYQILLILTDGEIHDMDATISLLVNNCHLPLSIIIVGVGNSDFDNMQKLDGDNGLFDDKGKKASRDIVQFVPFRNVGMNPDLLAKQLLAELPSQVTAFMSSVGKMPNKVVPNDINQLYMSNKSIEISPQQAMRLNLNNILFNSIQIQKH